MGRRERAKGKRGQREAARLLRECGWDARTEGGAQSHGAHVPDVDAPGLPVWPEVKVGARPNLLAAYRQAHRDAPRWREPVVLARLVSTRGTREDPCRRWLALVDARFFLALLRSERRT